MSLKDQLMKAGLANAKKARQAEHAKRVQARDTQAPTSQEMARQALAEKAGRDRELNRVRDAEQAQKALPAQIRQLIGAHRIDRKGGDIAYQFTDQRKIKKLYVTAAQQEQLARGQIAIVRLDDGHELVPTIVAEKIRGRDDDAVVLLNSRASTSQDTDDDPYAAYQIPDDLMW
jgi:VCBS repeat-containing protein